MTHEPTRAGGSAAEVARRQREKAERLTRAAELWDQGTSGERATADVLAALPDGEWQTFHDLGWPGRSRANIDHVVVGPPGVFVIDSKNWTGTITVQDGVLRQNRRGREKAIAEAQEAARAVATLIPAVRPEDVHAVLCFTRDDPVTGRAREVAICSTGNVLQLLTTRPATLDPAARREVCRELDVATNRGTKSETTVRFGVLRTSATPTRPRNPSKLANTGSDARRDLRKLIAALVIAVLAFSVGPTLLKAVAQAVTDGVTSVIQPEPAPGQTEEPAEPDPRKG